MEKLFDMHCHLDFTDDAKQIAASTAGSIVAVDATVVPSSYVSAQERFSRFPDVHVGLGMHPWWIADGRVGEADIDRFCNLAPGVRIIGEIGLDFYGKRKVTRTHQLDVFARLLEAVHDAGGGRLVFLHAVKSYDDTFDLLERYDALKENLCVFHWFSGTPDDFARALALGAFFSVGMRMMATDAGALFAKSIPDDRILAETDSPPSEGVAWSAGAWDQELRNTIASLAEARGVSFDSMSATLAANSMRLLRESDAIETGA